MKACTLLIIFSTFLAHHRILAAGNIPEPPVVAPFFEDIKPVPSERDLQRTLQEKSDVLEQHHHKADLFATEAQRGKGDRVPQPPGPEPHLYKNLKKQHHIPPPPGPAPHLHKEKHHHIPPPPGPAPHLNMKVAPDAWQQNHDQEEKSRLLKNHRHRINAGIPLKPGRAPRIHVGPGLSPAEQKFAEMQKSHVLARLKARADQFTTESKPGHRHHKTHGAHSCEQEVHRLRKDLSRIHHIIGRHLR